VFTTFVNFSGGSAVSTGLTQSYYYVGGGPFDAALFVYPVDLSSFGIALGSAVTAIRVTSDTEGDLIRVAGFANAAPPAEIPEPGSLALLSLGLIAASALRVKNRWKVKPRS
jgi:hypothetical protein